MATSIEWCDETWNPTTGCGPVSPGCLNCYAATLAGRGMCDGHRDLVRITKRRNAAGRLVQRAVFNDRLHLHPDRLEKPLRWRKPRRVFVNSMSDLFHERVPFRFIAAVFGAMAACPQHTFLVLTKRPAVAIEFFAWLDGAREKIRGGTYGEADFCGGELFDVVARQDFDAAERWVYPLGHVMKARPWPLPNVHLGVSAEDQATLDERVPLLLQCPAALHWVSAEPLLGPLDLAAANVKRLIGCPQIGWVVVGGESGAGARGCDVIWIRTIVNDCRRAGVPVFVKQLGAQPYGYVCCSGVDSFGDGCACFGVTIEESPPSDRKGKDPGEWPEDLRVRELPEVRPC